MIEDVYFFKEVITMYSKLRYRVDECIGGGSQGEIYRVSRKGSSAAVKCFDFQYLKEDTHLIERLNTLISMGTPDHRFIWPLEMVTYNVDCGIGYLMELLDSRFVRMDKLMNRKVQLSFKKLITICFELADSFLQLHSMGLCYKDIAFKNIFFDSETGEISIVDTDNVDIDNGRPGYVLGTKRFVAPEVMERRNFPNITSDLYSLAVLFFYLLVTRSPFQRENEISSKNENSSSNNPWKSHPLFIFPPDNDVEPSEGEVYNNEIRRYWNLYPTFIKALFIRSFTEGIENPKTGRVRDSEWRQALSRLRDSIVNCNHCGNEFFFDFDKKEICGKQKRLCRICGKKIRKPVILRIGRHQLIINHDTQLYPHYIYHDRLYDFSSTIASMDSCSKKGNSIRRLKNLSKFRWIVRKANGIKDIVTPGQSFAVTRGLRILFGPNEGEICY